MHRWRLDQCVDLVLESEMKDAAKAVRVSPRTFVTFRLLYDRRTVYGIQNIQIRPAGALEPGHLVEKAVLWSSFSAEGPRWLRVSCYGLLHGPVRTRTV